MKKIVSVVVTFALGLVFVLGQTVSVSATGPFEGLTPGFWKNHTEAWGPTEYSPNQMVSSVFSVPSSYGLTGKTLLQALSFKGGPGEAGAAQILLRASVAAILNAGDPEIKYPFILSSIISNTNDELDSHNRADMLWLAAVWDSYNNLGLVN
jgi:hypothetical protein